MKKIEQEKEKEREEEMGRNAQLPYRHVEFDDMEIKQYNEDLNLNDLLRLSSLLMSHMLEMQSKGVPDKKAFIKTRSLNMKLSKMMVDMKGK